MPGDLFPDSTLHLLEKSLSWHNRGQEIIAGNLANLETPGFTRKELNFKEVLRDYLQGLSIKLAATNPRHIQGARLETNLVSDSNEPVDLDREMVHLSVNQLQYQTSVTMLMKKLGTLKAVIEGDIQ
ncbi:MAG: flagellar basal body rod protein FlgB [Thermodesulfobacteriota bacterium]